MRVVRQCHYQPFWKPLAALWLAEIFPPCHVSTNETTPVLFVFYIPENVKLSRIFGYLIISLFFAVKLNNFCGNFCRFTWGGKNVRWPVMVTTQTRMETQFKIKNAKIRMELQLWPIFPPFLPLSPPPSHPLSEVKYGGHGGPELRRFLQFELRRTPYAVFHVYSLRKNRAWGLKPT